MTPKIVEYQLPTTVNEGEDELVNSYFSVWYSPIPISDKNVGFEITEKEAKETKVCLVSLVLGFLN